MIRGNEHIHFAGIGGIGMSALAGFLRKKQFTISGSDTNLTQKTIQQLRALGCTIEHQDTVDLARLRPDVVVYSSAVAAHTPIRRTAEQLQIPCVHRSELLAEITKQYCSIAITGAHGKTTTTAMIGHILHTCATSSNILLGGFLQSINANFLVGSGRHLVVEADESDRSMIKLFPTITVVTNIDREHTDTYRDIQDMETACMQFMEKTPWFGKCICYLDTRHNQWKNLPRDLTKKCFFYGRTTDADIQIFNEMDTKNGSSAQIRLPNNEELTLTLPISGSHNIENAVGALTAAYVCGIPIPAIVAALATYSGVEQRFTHRGQYQQAQVIDDYAHHPVEIDRALYMAKQKEPKRLIVIFQPHRYTRTESLWNDFIDTFSRHTIDILCITDIYAASEPALNHAITSKNLVEQINQTMHKENAIYIPEDNGYALIKTYLSKTAQEGDLILFLGAGSVNKLAQELTTK